MTCSKQLKTEGMWLFLAAISLFLLNYKEYFNSNKTILWYNLHKDAT